MAWSPRVTLSWAVGLAVIAVELHDRSPRWYWGVALLVWQAAALYFVRDYDPVRRMLDSQDYYPYAATTPAEKRFLGKLAETLPRSYTIATNGDYFAVFHRQSVVWPDHPTVAHPDMFVCDTENRAVYRQNCLEGLRASGLATARVGGFLVGYRPSAKELVKKAEGAGTP